MNESSNIQETTVKFKYFAIITKNPDEFVNELENLCKKFSLQGDFFFRFDYD